MRGARRRGKAGRIRATEVVGTKYATRFIRDGQPVTVDGDRGLVHLR